MQPTSPEVLTPERIDAMLSRAAEVCMAGVEEAGVRMKAADDAEAFERCGRTLNTACRNLRQVIAMKQRFDRDQIVLTAERRRADEAGEKDAATARKRATFAHHMRIRSHFERVLWEVYDDEDDAQEVFEALDEFLGELSEAEDFLDTPAETLIARLTEEYCPQPDEDEAAAEDAAPAVPAQAAPPDGEPGPAHELESDASPGPPPRPPDPYRAWFERGQVFPDGSRL